MARERYAFFVSILSSLGFLFFTDSLSSQPWYKISLEEEGIYKIDSDDLSEAGVNVGAVDPSRDLDEERPALREIPIYASGGDDGTFESEDFILFYGSALSDWDYDQETNGYTHYLNHYTNTNVYGSPSMALTLAKG